MPKNQLKKEKASFQDLIGVNLCRWLKVMRYLYLHSSQNAPSSVSNLILIHVLRQPSWTPAIVPVHSQGIMILLPRAPSKQIRQSGSKLSGGFTAWDWVGLLMGWTVVAFRCRFCCVDSYWIICETQPIRVSNSFTCVFAIELCWCFWFSLLKIQEWISISAWRRLIRSYFHDYQLL